ncbi:hypothetical protein ACIQVT_34510 [Streptomyces sp. NPDC100445]|uniref:hypothetical protein n=1 Tax=Streptomyces sp. NPDC100445 TaxID=3366102 RepID=UPI003816398E
MTDTLPEMPPIESPADTPPAAPKRGRGRPKGSTDRAPRATTPRARKSTTPNLEKRLASSLTTLGTLGCLVSPADGMVVVQGVPALAAALAKLADENPAVRANLERMLTAGAWSGVIAAVVPMVIGIMANHGAIPPAMAAMFGAPTPPENGGVDASN